MIPRPRLTRGLTRGPRTRPAPEVAPKRRLPRLPPTPNGWCASAKSSSSTLSICAGSAASSALGPNGSRGWWRRWRRSPPSATRRRRNSKRWTRTRSPTRRRGRHFAPSSKTSTWTTASSTRRPTSHSQPRRRSESKSRPWKRSSRSRNAPSASWPATSRSSFPTTHLRRQPLPNQRRQQRLPLFPCPCRFRQCSLRARRRPSGRPP
jgi:hypothetical protein